MVQLIICPSKSVLEKANNALKKINKDLRGKRYKSMSKLVLHMHRLITELEYETGDEKILDKIIDRVSKTPKICKKDKCWTQLLSSFVEILCNLGEIDLAEKYYSEYQNYSGNHTSYYENIDVALKTTIELAKSNGDRLIAQDIIDNIKNAYDKSREDLHDYRLQGWTSGLWGECLVLAGKDVIGNRQIRESLKNRYTSGEQGLNYEKWLKRLQKYELEQNTSAMIKKELERIGRSI